jgi:predicted nucleic-acid-binding Zn-ribbon protein
MGLKSGTCPHCGSDEIYENSSVSAGAKNSMPVKLTWYLSLDITLTTLVCTGCGYLENYIADEESLPDIRKAWQPLNKTKRKNE